MTAKSKIRNRKAPAAKANAPKAVPIESKPNGSSVAQKLIARWDFLTADAAYKASIAATDGESYACICMHTREQDKIADSLADLRPVSCYDAMSLLQFVVQETKDGALRCDDLEFKIIRNVTEALHGLYREEIDKAEREGAAKTKAEMRDIYHWAIEAAEKSR